MTNSRLTYKLKISPNFSGVVQDDARSSYIPFSVKGSKYFKEAFEKYLCENLRITLNRLPRFVKASVLPHPTLTKMSFSIHHLRVDYVLQLATHGRLRSISEYCSFVDYEILNSFSGVQNDQGLPYSGQVNDVTCTEC